MGRCDLETRIYSRPFPQEAELISPARSTLAPSTAVAPNPWRPAPNGTDIWAEAVAVAHDRANHRVDDWLALHFRKGEMHCGTSSQRDRLHSVKAVVEISQHSGLESMDWTAE
ncbi:protein-arginine deiminase (PAD) domain-containing protein [Hirsutella rhossiliensis]|uniref:Protein-arginine deiminase (PAD) domain-containing protein n=1 Tax=Hirsutella rhossiliensis TaxID=111463 RepID=A0A9P8SG60_9HYPO|nr:protein-arginine deiminase (PAD) domain-containing protein [Hirsutella rhossiliensis]KAH0961471.1 protein-arginine deiminase (PAD) domain-containing protein [Hirsutella rhossiliensis]